MNILEIRDFLDHATNAGEKRFYDVRFNNIGFIQAKFNDKELKPIWDEINTIKKNFDNARAVNKELAGNIEHEFALPKNIKYAEQLIIPLVIEYDKLTRGLTMQSILTKPAPIILDNLWVNFQKKNEFNPPHIHLGLYSFVIWMDIPYDIEDEKSVKQSKNSAINIPGHFQFLYTNSIGQISQYNIPVDKTYNGIIALFPANLTHAVYPFTTSDDYRITVSGNFKYKV